MFSMVAYCADEWRSEEFNCALTPPTSADWTQPPAPNPSIKFLAQTKDHSTSVILSVIPLPPEKNEKLNTRFIEAFEGTYFKPGLSKKTSGVELVIQGIPAYKITGELYANGTTFYRAATLWIADNRFYQITALKSKSLPLDDPELRAFISSFHFLHPPKI